MSNTIDAQKLAESLSNFYAEYGYNNINIDFFVDLYIEMADALDEYLTSIRRNQTVKSMGTFRKYNFAILDGHTATYDLDMILLSQEVAALVGLSGSLSDRHTQWEALTSKMKALALIRSDKYITLSAKRPLDSVEPEILELQLRDLKSVPYVEGVDYFLYENKVFLLGDKAKAIVQNEKLFATDIYVNYRTPELLLGSRIGIGYNESVSYPEYRDFLQMVTHVLIKGPTAANLKAAFNLLAGWEGSGVTDMISATGIRRELWTNPATAILTPFDFLITIPAAVANTVGYDDLGNLVSNTDRLDIFSEFINVVKPTDTNYIVALSNAIQEQTKNDDRVGGLITVPFVDGRPANDSPWPKTVIPVTELFSHMVVLEGAKFDSGDDFDQGFSYDGTTFDTNVPGIGYGDMVRMNHITYPEFPVQFTATQNILTGHVTCTFKDNAVEVEGYKIFRNDILITTITPALGNSSDKSYLDTAISALPPGTYTYYAKSFYTVGPTEFFSRPSKIITIVK